MAGENPANNVFVDEDVKSQGYLLRNASTAPSGIALPHLDHRVDEFFAGPFGPGLPLRFDEKSRPYFWFLRAWWMLKRVEVFSTMAERIRRAGRMRRAHKPTTRRSEKHRLGDRCRKAIEDQELLLNKNGLGDHRTDAVTLRKTTEDVALDDFQYSTHSARTSGRNAGHRAGAGLHGPSEEYPQ
jgi:hypothetical protein